MKLEENEPINGWWYPKELRQKKTDNIEILGKIRHDTKSPHYCNQCEKTWQKKPSNFARNKKVMSLYDFYDKGSLPTYKLERRLCPLCSQG